MNSNAQINEAGPSRGNCRNSFEIRLPQQELGARPVMRVTKEAVLFGPSERSYGRFLGSREL